MPPYNEQQGRYEPVGIAAAVLPRYPGLTEGILGVLASLIAPVLYPVIFGLVGVILGIIAVRRGQKLLGICAIVLCILTSLFGIALDSWMTSHPGFRFELQPVVTGE